MQVDPEATFMLVLGPVSIGILLAALIWFIQRRWPRDKGGPPGPGA